MRSLVALPVLVVVVGVPVAAQEAEHVYVGSILESYAFHDGSVVESMSQLTIPLAVDVSLGERASLVVSTGYASVRLESNDPAQLASRTLNGPLDTELRLDVHLVPDRLVTFLAATVPTGRQAVLDEQLAMLVALANEAIGFSAPSLGSGGSVTGGFSTAFPMGRFALGVAATAVYSFAYEPVLSEPVSLSPGAEARVRVGLEGALAGRTYLRIAVSGAARQKDELNDDRGHGLGRRAIGYVTLEQGVGPVVLSLYAFDVYRGSPQLEPTALGSAILPRGNLVAGGASLSVPVTSRASLVPSVEYRVAAAAESVDTSRLRRQASSVRAGAELRARLNDLLSISLRGQGAFGDVRQGAAFHDFTGFRASAGLEVTP